MLSPTIKAGRLPRILRGMALRKQLMLLYGVLFTALTAGSCLIVSSELQSASKHQADTIGDLLSQQTASAATDMLVTGDRISLNVLLNQLVQNPYVAKAAIFSIDSRSIASAESNSAKTLSGATYSSPIHYQDVIAGYVRLQLDERLLTRNPRDALTLIITISVILLLAGLLILNFYSVHLSRRIVLIDRQLRSILPHPAGEYVGSSEVGRLSSFVEGQLTEKLPLAEAEAEPEPEDETAAIISLRHKNLSRLRQLLAPHDLVDILETYTAGAEKASALYGGELSYTPEGNAYIRFSSLDSEDFALNALCCALLIESLNRVFAENSVARLQMGLGLCLSDGMPDFPGEEHPSQGDSAAGIALMLASLPESDTLHMFRDQLRWLPAELPEIKVSDHGEDIIQILGASEPRAGMINQQAYTLSRELEEA